MICASWFSFSPKIFPYRCCTLSALHGGSLSAHSSSSSSHHKKSIRMPLTSSDHFMIMLPIRQVKPSPSLFLCMASPSNVDNDGLEDPDTPISSSSNRNGSVGMGAKGSGTTARGRRLLKLREEKRKREYDRLHNYPSWAKYLIFSLFFHLFALTSMWFNFYIKTKVYDSQIHFVLWANRVLEDACRDDAELRAVLGDSIGNPDLMRKRVL